MNETIDRNSSVPLNRQLEYIIRKNISEEVWLPGTKIPSEKNLCSIYGVSHITVRSAVSSLINDGLLYSIHGKGTYVSEPRIDIDSYNGIVTQLGMNKTDFSYSQLLSFEIKKADSYICSHFQLDTNADFYVYERLSQIQGRIFGHHISYLPVNLVPGLKGSDVLNSHSGEILARNGHYGDKILESLEVIHADSKMSHLLEVSKNYPLYHLENIFYKPDGNALYLTRLTFSTRKITLHFEGHHPLD